MNTLARIRDLIVDHLGVSPDEVTLAASFRDDLGADSLDAVELVMAFEEEFGVEFPDAEMEAMHTVADAVRLVEARQGQPRRVRLQAANPPFLDYESEGPGEPATPAETILIGLGSVLSALLVISLIVWLFIRATEARADEAPKASGVTLCWSWPLIKQRFAEFYHEVPVSGGMVNANTVIQVLASPSGDTWSIFEVSRSGIACLKAAGTGWEPGVLPAKGQPT